MTTEENIKEPREFLDPCHQMTATLYFFDQGEGEPREISPTDIMNEVKKQVLAIQAGDLSQIETSLYTQAIILQHSLHKMMRLFAISAEPKASLELMNISLKVQNQLRTTLETLSRIGWPPLRTMILNEQNNTFLQGKKHDSLLPSKTNSKSANELLRGVANEKMDTRRPLTSIEDNPSLATMAAIDRR